jgi:hypothetical protein
MLFASDPDPTTQGSNVEQVIPEYPFEQEQLHLPTTPLAVAPLAHSIVPSSPELSDVQAFAISHVVPEYPAEHVQVHSPVVPAATPPF